MDTNNIIDGEKLFADRSFVIHRWIGIDFSSSDFWEITCPCGHAAKYPINGLPTETTLHDCGHPEHYIIKF